MRFLRYAVPLAALLLAAPASAQPDGPRILRTAIDRLAADVTEVDDYTFTLANDDLRIPVYVHRTGQSWDVRLGRTPLEDLAQMAVFWPTLLDPAVSLGLQNAAYLRRETVDGRAAHVIDSPMGAGMGMEVDSVRVLVDTETRRIVRMVIAAQLPAGFGGDVFGQDAGMDIVVDAGEQRVTDGLSLPAWVRVRMGLELPNLPDEQRALMLRQFGQARDQLAASSEPEARDMLALVDMYVQLLSPGGMDVRMRVEDVAVNPGRPGWATGKGGAR
ncbi:hypothetical protein [Longimicrobium sp.]|uniref:hypothetical protein n=1 Tax=Longimicrobium sp. TaxID=2029185 RepID=UPI002E3216CE|nr:hypothetical protein [Longimicrobium sp.]HEX6042169.1 hypothetical protein [Longimicrobium sp.]